MTQSPRLTGAGEQRCQAEAPVNGLRSRFLAALDPLTRSRIFHQSARVAEGLEPWAAGYPLMRRARVRPLALSVTAAASFGTVDGLISVARLNLWVFALDDLFDEEGRPDTELLERAEHYQRVAHNQAPARFDDPLAVALAEVRADLARYPLFARLGPEWARALGGTIAGMTREYQWRLAYRERAEAALPTYDEYLAIGRYSVGGPPHIWATWITADDPSTPRHLVHLRSMEREASRCIRLANDLQSYAKEIREGKVNAPLIVSQALERSGLAQDAAQRQARCSLEAEIAAGLDRLAQLQAAGATQTGRPEAVAADIARFVCDFYQHHDFHTFGPPGKATDDT